MSRIILAFALVTSLSVGLANGQDAKKPVKDAPARVAGDNAKSPDQPTLATPRASDAKNRLRPATLNEKRMIQRRSGAPGPVPPRVKAIERKREVIRLANSPAMDVAQAINETLRNERLVGPSSSGEVVIVPDAISNSLIISGAPQAIKEIVGMVKELDAETPMVAIRVLMAEIISEGKTSVILDDLSAFVEKGSDARKKGTKPILLASHDAALAMVRELAGEEGVEILARVRVTTLDNQSAYIQIGSRVPVGPAGGRDKSGRIQSENVGLILGVTPRIDPEGAVSMEIDFEKSELGDAAGRESAPPIETIRVQTTVSVADGRTLVLGGLVAEAGDDKHELLVVVTPQIVTAK